MRKTWISAALAQALALLAGPLWAQQRAPTTVVACSGTFAKDSSHLELTTALNSKNVTFADVEAADGTKVPASILFPNDPKRRLEVWWSDRTHRSDIHLIVIGGKSTWTAPDGLRVTAMRASACAPMRRLQLKRSVHFQPTRNTVPPIRQFARQSRQLAKF